MENMVNFNKLFGRIYNDKKVLVTGYTGFKGSWLSLWLEMMGAKVYGYALAPPSNPSHIETLDLKINGKKGDIRDQKSLLSFINEVNPDIVFHLAAQALVRSSYDDPIETYSTNVMGTLNLFEVCRKVKSVKAIVNVTSDKCYENKEWVWGYRENDPMGGFDPYSSSKGCSELLTNSYRNSFFNLSEYGQKHNILLASARAGNVIGGGDWAKDRLFPDIIKAASINSFVSIRNPKATRPWQHVMEPLSGYLTLGWRLLEGKKEFAESWNFGPVNGCNLYVEEIVNYSKLYWKSINVEYKHEPSDAHEANLLMLDCSKANKLLKWKPVWMINDTIEKTINWYKIYYSQNIINTENDICEYVNTAQENELIWTI
jgi:CDP-glucose 4,6-dehydratase